MTYDVEINGRVRRVDIQRGGPGFLVTVDGQRHNADVTHSEGVWSLILEDAPAGDAGADRRSYEIAIVEEPATGRVTVHVNGRVVTATVGAARGSWARRGHESGGAGQGPQRIVAPMPGKVVRVLVEPGHQVAPRQGVVIVEAMKMENELRATRAGTVREVKVAEGSSVEAGAIMVVID